MDVAIIGAGYSGLYAGWRLSRRHAVTIFEASPEAGGLTGQAILGGRRVDKYYHFICRPDHHYLGVIDELALTPRLGFHPSRTGFFYRGTLYPFSKPLDLMTFKPLGLTHRLRFGFHILNSKYRTDWSDLDRIPAKEWIIFHIGRDAYEVIWEPLLKLKFGAWHEQISAAWIWHRINRVARSRRRPWGFEDFGVLDEGTGLVLDALAGRIRAQGGSIRLGTSVERIEKTGARFRLHAAGTAHGPFDAVFSTVPLPVLGGMIREADQGFGAFLQKFRYAGVRCLAMALDRELSPYFWLNINDPAVPFNGVIGITNLQPHRQARGEHVSYIPSYIQTSDELYDLSEGAFVERFLAALPRVFPDFEPAWVKDVLVRRDPYAQPICTVNIAREIPDVAPPHPGLYICEAFQLYPEDRTLSGMGITADRAITAFESKFAGR